jgi:hypothetical protein
MSKRIIYQTDAGGVSVLTPTEDRGLTVQQVAEKDVPAGKPFKIVDETDIPKDRSERNSRTVDAATLTDGVGADYGEGSVWCVLDYVREIPVLSHSDPDVDIVKYDGVEYKGAIQINADTGEVTQ